MSIKPIDFQVNIPKTIEVSKIQNDAQQRNLSQQQQNAATVRQGIEHNLHQVYAQDDPQKTGIRERQEKNRKKQQEGEKGKNRSGETAPKEDKKSEIKRSTIDIRL